MTRHVRDQRMIKKKGNEIKKLQNDLVKLQAAKTGSLERNASVSLLYLCHLLMLLFRPKFNLIRPLHISFVALSTFCFLIPFPRNYSQSIPKRLSDLFPTPLCTRSMALRLSSQQQNSCLQLKKKEVTK